MDDRAALGRFGEDQAAAYLKASGYRILERIFRCPRGEIDIVAQSGLLIALVEVKTRRGASFGAPCEAVSAIKRRRLLLAAGNYMQKLNCSAYTEKKGLGRAALENWEFRLDVIEVSLGENGVRLHHLEDAFRL